MKKVFFLIGMSKVFFGTLIFHARSHINAVPDLLQRAAHFMPERSINSAIAELKQAIQYLEEARNAYSSQFESKHHHHPLK